MTVKDIFELRRQGKTEEAYQLILEQYKNYHGHYTTICMFWCATDMANCANTQHNTHPDPFAYALP